MNTKTNERVNLGQRERERKERISLGIAICHAQTKPGQVRTHAEIAAYAGCTRTAIQMIEARALMKMKIRLMEFLDDSDVTAAKALHLFSSSRAPARAIPARAA